MADGKQEKIPPPERQNYVRLTCCPLSTCGMKRKSNPERANPHASITQTRTGYLRSNGIREKKLTGRGASSREKKSRKQEIKKMTAPRSWAGRAVSGSPIPYLTKKRDYAQPSFLPATGAGAGSKSQRERSQSTRTLETGRAASFLRRSPAGPALRGRQGRRRGGGGEAILRLSFGNQALSEEKLLKSAHQIAERFKSCGRKDGVVLYTASQKAVIVESGEPEGMKSLFGEKVGVGEISIE